MTELQFDEKTLRVLKLLSRSYPTTQAVSTEIINLRAILNLPKGTEHYISDIHGEYEGFRHILRNASGSVRRKIDQTLGDYVPSAERDALAALIYYPERKLRHMRHEGTLTKEWYTITLKQLVAVCKITTSKYTRSKVRKMLPKDFEYIISELMTTGSKDFNKEEYFGNTEDVAEFSVWSWVHASEDFSWTEKNLPDIYVKIQLTTGECDFTVEPWQGEEGGYLYDI